MPTCNAGNETRPIPPPLGADYFAYALPSSSEDSSASSSQYSSLSPPSFHSSLHTWLYLHRVFLMNSHSHCSTRSPSNELRKNYLFTPRGTDGGSLCKTRMAIPSQRVATAEFTLCLVQPFGYFQPTCRKQLQRFVYISPRSFKKIATQRSRTRPTSVICTH